jgi:A/G-specific adenine glycosylase
MLDEIAPALLKWYEKAGRSMPWRGASDPYLIWVSEIMLQQTRVDTVIPYYLRWIQEFPTVYALASASEETVLLLWEGLGYYNRAKNMHLTAQTIVEQFQGEFPRTPQELRKLPGIGEYTANAIASICFAFPAVALDANIKRVLARLSDLDEPLENRSALIKLAQFAADLIMDGHAGDFNQALMDLGAMICLPSGPRCSACPLQNYCAAFIHHTQNQRPVLRPKKPIPEYQVVAAIISNGDGTFLLAKRPKGGMLPGLWEFPGGKVEVGENDGAALQREIVEELGTSISIGALIGSYKHAYTHFKVVVRAYRCQLQGPPPQALEAQQLVWARCEEMAQFAMGKVDRMISCDLCSIVSE